ncbi:MAG: hypothetical protein AB7Y74_11135 [Syntrophorhabdus sp.]
MGKELTLKTAIKKVKKSMEQSLVEIFGCVSLDGNATVKRNVVKDRRQINRYFYLDRGPMEEMLVEVFGCILLDHKVILLDVIRDRKRIEREFRIPIVATDSSTEWLKRVHVHLS